ncbi:formate hydrogenlyase subunit 5 precursor [bacterium BMS3Bbin12]|nr:formate hydrogenlyase subunit 5 precursor [bacterium BMS3Abin12]GBE47285.1 formate hydrogenlyase subunit 5 precursor [bacterium BMS3Bbin12]GBE50676.1 formate hydrogenlyase subunit 5 precursor [bacterium BMS3Bbin13]
MSRLTTLAEALADHPGLESSRLKQDRLELAAVPGAVSVLVELLTHEYGFEFATLLAEDLDCGFTLHYFFFHPADHVLVSIGTSASGELPTISDRIYAADLYEREAEDLFGLHFSGHPFLGDFVLHDDVWPEAVAPMCRRYAATTPSASAERASTWHPRRQLTESGSVVFPVGPVWGDYLEAGLYVLEGPGEQIRLAHTRLFYKYRAVEKIAEGLPVPAVLLLAERFSGNAAVAHALALCQAAERISHTVVPERARRLRVVLAELERMRYHMAVMAELAGSTGLAVGKAMGQELEEALLRLAARVGGHRYLFGLIAPGGLARDLDAGALATLGAELPLIVTRIRRYRRLLEASSSFLDRIEEVGALDAALTARYATVGPVGRASGRSLDLRCALPYAGYACLPPTVAVESEGDGYARMRVFFHEIEDSGALIGAALDALPSGAAATGWEPCEGSALGWAEAPSGAFFDWLRLDADGRVQRWSAGTPGYRNWHAFHRAVEGATFQDFPIIMASFGLSVAENDR